MNPIAAPASDKPRVVIVGAGFGGLRAAKALAKADAEIALIDKHNYHLFQPLLYQVSTAGLSVDDIAYPTRAVIRKQKNIRFWMGEVESIDLENKIVQTDNAALPYDYLILATGGVTNFFGMRQVEDNAFGMKTLDESVVIRNHILKQFELAANETDADKRRALLTFVVVGGGPTGVEEAGALSELIHFVLKKEFSYINFKEVRIILFEATDRLLPAMPESLRESTFETLLRKQVEVRLCVQVTDYDGWRLSLKGGEIIPTATVVWAAGIKAVDFGLNVEQDRSHRIKVNENLQIPSHPDVFVIGDAAHFVQDGAPLPMIAPVAMQQADTVAKNVIRRLKDKELLPFRFKSVGAMATIGRNAAVVSMGKFHCKGFVAWLIWSSVHIWRLVDFRNRAVVFFKWISDYLIYERVSRIITRER